MCVVAYPTYTDGGSTGGDYGGVTGGSDDGEQEGILSGRSGCVAIGELIVSKQLLKGLNRKRRLYNVTIIMIC